MTYVLFALLAFGIVKFIYNDYKDFCEYLRDRDNE